MKISVVFGRFFLILYVALGVGYGSTPSAFELQSGATKADIKELKDAAQNAYKNLTNIQSQSNATSQKVDGLQSLYQSQVKRLKDAESLISKQQEQITLLEIQNNTLKSELNATKIQAQNNAKNIQNLDKKIKDLSKIISDLNSLLQNKLESKNTKSIKDTNTTSATKAITQNKASKTFTFSKDKNKREDTFTQAKAYYNKGEYSKASEIFKWMLESKYRRAESNYYLGEIAHKAKRYKEAIFYYKESALLHDEASYMPNLLLNTARSFKEIGDNTNANKFISTLEGNYPKANETKEAQKLKTSIK